MEGSGPEGAGGRRRALRDRGGGFDFAENRALLDAPKLPAEPQYDPHVSEIYSAAMWKWGLLFVTMFLLSFVFTGRRDFASARQCCENYIRTRKAISDSFSGGRDIDTYTAYRP